MKKQDICYYIFSMLYFRRAFLSAPLILLIVWTGWGAVPAGETQAWLKCYQSPQAMLLRYGSNDPDVAQAIQGELVKSVSWLRQTPVDTLDTLWSEENPDYGNIFTFNPKNKFFDCITGSVFFVGSYFITYFFGEKNEFYEFYTIRDRVSGRSLVEAEAGAVWCVRLAGIYLGFKGLLEILLEKIDLMDYTDPINYKPFDIFEYFKDKEQKEKEKQKKKQEDGEEPESRAPPGFTEYYSLCFSQPLPDQASREALVRKMTRAILTQWSQVPAPGRP